MNEIDEIKKRIDIVDFISKYLTLKKAGANYKVPCPFHNEKSASFMVSPEKQIFKCFGCGAGGSVIDFLMQMENLELKEAIQVLAEQAGVELKSNKGTYEGVTKGSKDRLYALNRFAARFFHKVLSEHPSGENALKYLNERGIGRSVVNDYQIGYAPRQKILADYLKKYGYSDQEIKLAGNPSMFFGRIMFPISDSLGHIIAFTGRVVGIGEPKYLNTPETKIFDKSRVLYGLNWARQEIKNKDYVVLVEGQTDVIFCQTNGFVNTVASSGTALTDDHLKIISRLTSNLLLAYDQDSAGEKATKRAFEMADDLGLNVKIIELPEGMDPADVIRKDPKIWEDGVNGAKRVIDYYLDRALSRYKKPYDVEAKKKIAGEILPLIRVLTDPIEQSHYIQLLAGQLGTEQEVIIKAIERLKNPESAKKSSSEEIKKPKPITSEETFIGILTIHPDLFVKHHNAISEHLFQDNYVKSIYLSLEKAYTKKEIVQGFDIFGYIKKELGDELAEKLSLIVLSLEKMDSSDPVVAESELEALILRYKLNKNEKILDEFATKIANAEQAGDRELVRKLNKELTDAIKKS